MEKIRMTNGEVVPDEVGAEWLRRTSSKDALLHRPGQELLDPFRPVNNATIRETLKLGLQRPPLTAGPTIIPAICSALPDPVPANHPISYRDSPRTDKRTLFFPHRRLKSVKNIEKITKSMKVVASTKLTRAEKAMKQAKKYGAANEGESGTCVEVIRNTTNGWLNRNETSLAVGSRGQSSSRTPRSVRTVVMPRSSTSPSPPTEVFAVVSTLP